MSINGINNTPPLANYNPQPPATQNQKPFDMSDGAISFNTQAPDNPQHRSANPQTDGNGGSGGTSQAATDSTTSVTLPNGQVYTGAGATEIQAQRAFAEQGFQRSMALMTLQEEVNQRAQQIQAQSNVLKKKDEVSSMVINNVK